MSSLFIDFATWSYNEHLLSQDVRVSRPPTPQGSGADQVYSGSCGDCRNPRSGGKCIAKAAERYIGIALVQQTTSLAIPLRVARVRFAACFCSATNERLPAE